MITYNDKKELDDIQRKAKLYLEKLFPQKFLYSLEVDRISFTPRYYLSGMSSQVYLDAWKQGKEELTNLIDTRIEEAKLIIAKPQIETQNIKIVEKVVQVEDYKRINQLTDEINAVKAKKNLWARINYFALGGILLTLIGGAFLLGKYFGENRFDQQKIDLLFENKAVTKRKDSLLTELVNLKKQSFLKVDRKK